MTKEKKNSHPVTDTTLVKGKLESFPYSKGILSQSLLSAGLTLDQAYQVAQEIEDQFYKRKRKEITSSELRKLTAKVVAKRFGEELSQSYISISSGPRTMQVLYEDSSLPFSKGILSQSLMAAGLSPEAAFAVSARIQRNLDRDETRTITHDELRSRVSKVLEDEFGRTYARNYLLWRKMREPDKPLIILIGGGSGVGKTSISRELSHRTGVGRMVSTDIIRQIMRMMFSPELMPSVHISSYEAFKTQPQSGMFDNPVISGFLEQSRLVLVGVKALIERAIKENISMIIDGVHNIPGLIDPRKIQGAYPVFFVLSTEYMDAHRSRFISRAEESNRSASRYLKYFKNIRTIQDYIIEQAEKFDIPMIDNHSLDKSIIQTLRLVTDKVAQFVDIPQFSE